MDKNELNNESALDSYIKCSNCRQNILSSKMFLHEGFCSRNNKYCEKCQKVVLIKDYDEHIKNHLNPTIKNATLKEEPINLEKHIKNENILNKKEKGQVTVNQINYNSFVNMNIPNDVKRKEIIKYNAPIIINTFDNQIHTPEYYRNFFLRNYSMANLLKVNEIDDVMENNKFLEMKNILENKKNENSYNITEIYKGSDISYLNENNRQYSAKMINNYKFLKDDRNKNREKKEDIDYGSSKKINKRDNNKIVHDNNIYNDRYNKKVINIQKKKIKNIIPSRSFDNKKYNQNNGKIFSNENGLAKNKHNIINGHDYKFNNYIIRKKNLINKIPKKEHQSNFVGKDIRNHHSSANFDLKEPLDRTTKLIKNMHKQNQEKDKKHNNIQFRNKFIGDKKSSNSKYEKCEYCNRVVEDLIQHYYRCEIRRMKEVERIQSKQNEQITYKSNEIEIHKPKNEKLNSYNIKTIDGGNKSDKQIKTQNNYYSGLNTENVDKNNRIIVPSGPSKIIRKKSPLDSIRDEQNIKKKERKFNDNKNKSSDVFDNNNFNKNSGKREDLKTCISHVNNTKIVTINLPDNKAFRGLQTP